jgi:hypothetical protein
MGTATGVDLTDLDNFVHYGPMLIYRGSLNSWDAAFRTIVRRRSPLENQRAWPFVRPDGERSRRRERAPAPIADARVVCVRYGSFTWV